MELISYDDKYKQQIIDLILHIQNSEFGLDLSLEDQPDLLDIGRNYMADGGGFWLMVEKDRVIGTIGLMIIDEKTAVLKKFFVDAAYRSQKVGLALYRQLLACVREKKQKYLVLDTPPAAQAAHRFYTKAGFRQITEEELPVRYSYPPREALLFLLEL